MASRVVGGVLGCGCLPCRLLLLLLLLCGGLYPVARGNPCSDGSHTCDLDTQKCVEVDANFTCQCLRADQQLNDFLVCTDLPDSQILYLTTPINTTNSDFELIFQVLSSPSLSEKTLVSLFNVSDFPTFKDVKFIEFRGIGPIPSYSIGVYAFLFSQNVTEDLRRKLALAVLQMEKTKVLRAPNGATAEIAGHTGIFDTLEDTKTDRDAIDWCSDPLLHSCPANSTCRDDSLRYNCSCNSGFVGDGTSCYVCDDDFRYGRDCALICDCLINNTVSCDHANGTCLCKEHWEGKRCDSDVNECVSSDDVCGDPLFHNCIDVVGGYQCVCVEGMLEDKITGDCRGAAIKAPPSPFETDGQRDLHLVCEVSNSGVSVTQYKWRDMVCVEEEGARCTLRPQPPWDDGKTVTCIAHFADGQSFTASSVLELNYPPSSAPRIEGYSSREKMPAGRPLKMVCTVAGGKPLVSAVLFSCPRHPDVTPDVISSSDVSSVLAWRLTSEDDEALCTCKALWKPGAGQGYSLTSSTALRVVEVEDTDGDMDFNWYMTFGVLGVLFIAMIALAVVVCKRRAQYSDSTIPSTHIIGVVTSTDKGQTTGMGSLQPSRDQKSSEDESGYTSPNSEQNLITPPRQHVWRPAGTFLPRVGSADDLTSWTVERRVRTDSQRHHRRNSTGGAHSGVYDQISAGVVPDFLSGAGSDPYLHPSSSLHPRHRPLPIPQQQQLYSPHHPQPASGAAPPYWQHAGFTGTRRQEMFYPTGAERNQYYI